MSAENLRSQLQLLKECYHVVSPDEVLDWVAGGRELPERAVLLTCDDGLRNVLTDMAPILRDEGVSCLFLVLGASAAQNPRILWYEELYLLLLAAPEGNHPFDANRDERRVGGPGAAEVGVVESGEKALTLRSAWQEQVSSKHPASSSDCPFSGTRHARTARRGIAALPCSTAANCGNLWTKG